jgi:hypothetical protein
MDRSAGSPAGFALLLLFVFAFGWVVWDGHGGHDHTAVLAGFRTAMQPARLAAAQAQPALDWPRDMPGPMTDYVGRRVSAFGLQVTTVDADEGFWVTKNGRAAWVQIETATESPYTVRPGDVVSLSGLVLPHDPNFPKQLFFCPDRGASAAQLSRTPTHFAVRVDALSFGVG